MNVIQLLENDHREVDELFRRVNLSEKDDSIGELTKQVVDDLSVHAAVDHATRCATCSAAVARARNRPGRWRPGRRSVVGVRSGGQARRQ